MVVSQAMFTTCSLWLPLLVSHPSLTRLQLIANLFRPTEYLTQQDLRTHPLLRMLSTVSTPHISALHIHEGS